MVNPKKRSPRTRQVHAPQGHPPDRGHGSPHTGKTFRARASNAKSAEALAFARQNLNAARDRARRDAEQVPVVAGPGSLPGVASFTFAPADRALMTDLLGHLRSRKSDQDAINSACDQLHRVAGALADLVSTLDPGAGQEELSAVLTGLTEAVGTLLPLATTASDDAPVVDSTRDDTTPDPEPDEASRDASVDEVVVEEV